MRLKPKSVSKLMYLSSTYFIRYSFYIICKDSDCECSESYFQIAERCLSYVKLRHLFELSKKIRDFFYLFIYLPRTFQEIAKFGVLGVSYIV